MKRTMPRPLIASIAFATIGVFSARADAHFVLIEPVCYSQEDSLGLPEKSAPCGQADPSIPVVPTNMVTTVAAGSSVTIQINEAIFHPGHYRVAIAQDQASLPADPPVTAGSTPCGSTVIAQNPTLPLLADGALLHTAPFSSPQSFTVEIPASFRCDHCVLQVIEFMSDHGLNNPGGCFYHHCATVTVVAPGTDAGTPADGGSPDAAGGIDGSTSHPDASTPQPDASTPQPDASTPRSDASTPRMDASSQPSQDAGQGATDAGDNNGSSSGGCTCIRAPSHASVTGVLVLGALVIAIGLGRRRSDLDDV